jgi:hypothetical protein
VVERENHLGTHTGGFAALHHRLISRHTFGVPS